MRTLQDWLKYVEKQEKALSDSKDKPEEIVAEAPPAEPPAETPVAKAPAPTPLAQAPAAPAPEAPAPERPAVVKAPPAPKPARPAPVGKTPPTVTVAPPVERQPVRVIQTPAPAPKTPEILVDLSYEDDRQVALPFLPEETPPPAPKPRAPRSPQPKAPAPIPDDESVEEMWGRLPKHIQLLMSASVDIDSEIAQKSYKVPFRETREDLIRRLLDPPMSLEDTARVLGVCPTTVRRYTNKGALPHYRTAGNQRRFRLSDVLSFLESNRRSHQSRSS